MGERKAGHREITPDLGLCDSGVLSFLNLDVSAKIFTPVGLIIAPEEKGAHAANGLQMVKNHPCGEKQIHLTFCQLHHGAKKKRPFHGAKVCKFCHKQNRFLWHPE